MIPTGVIRPGHGGARAPFLLSDICCRLWWGLYINYVIQNIPISVPPLLSSSGHTSGDTFQVKLSRNKPLRKAAQVDDEKDVSMVLIKIVGNSSKKIIS